MRWESSRAFAFLFAISLTSVVFTQVGSAHPADPDGWSRVFSLGPGAAQTRMIKRKVIAHRGVRFKVWEGISGQLGPLTYSSGTSLWRLVGARQRVPTIPPRKGRAFCSQRTVAEGFGWGRAAALVCDKFECSPPPTQQRRASPNLPLRYPQAGRWIKRRAP